MPKSKQQISGVLNARIIIWIFMATLKIYFSHYNSKMKHIDYHLSPELEFYAQISSSINAKTFTGAPSAQF